MYLLSNTQIYEIASYIPIKIRLKALKLLTQLSEKPKNKHKKEFKFQFFENPEILNTKFQFLKIANFKSRTPNPKSEIPNQNFKNPPNTLKSKKPKSHLMYFGFSKSVPNCN